MSSADRELLEEFAVEAKEHLEAIEPIILNAEWVTPTADQINLLFRSFHSIKGLARVIGLKGMEALAHQVESLLSIVRSGQRVFDAGIQEAVLAATDAMKAGRARVLEDGSDTAPAAGLMAKLAHLTQGGEAVANDIPDLPEETQIWTDLHNDHDTLIALAELLEERLPEMADMLCHPKLDLDQFNDDVETLTYAIEKLALPGLLASLAQLGVALDAGMTQRAVALAHLITQVDRFTRLIDRPSATTSAVEAGGSMLGIAFQDRLDALILAAESEPVSLSISDQILQQISQQAAQPASPPIALADLPELSKIASQLWSLSTVLMDSHPVAALLHARLMPVPDLLAASGPNRAELLPLLDALRADFESDASRASDLALLAADQARAQTGADCHLDAALLKRVQARKLDSDRLLALAPSARQRITETMDRVDQDFFEVLLEWPAETEAQYALAITIVQPLDPLLTETTKVDGASCLALLCIADKEAELRKRITNIDNAVTIVAIRKLDGRQTTAFFGPPQHPGEGGGAINAESQVRVPVELLDRLFGRVGEFFSISSNLNALMLDSAVPDVLLRLSDYAAAKAPELLPEVDMLVRQQREVALIEAELHRLVSLIHESTLGLRVIPLDYLFGRYPRMVRDTAHGQHKSVRFESRSNGIKIDKGMVEMLADPLMHILRNAVDHGIEPPADRLAAGKPAGASLLLQAEQSGNCIVIEISDDGRGIDIERVRQKAVANKIVQEADSLELTDEQIARFIFTPGFSTAQQVSDTSGRGVGMDVALVNVTQLGGKIDIQSRAGRGTTFRIEMPLSAAIQAVLLTETQFQGIAFPERMVTETRVFPRTEVQIVNGQRAILMHKHFLPIFRITDLLRLPTTEAPESPEMAIVVCQLDRHRIGIEVHAILRRHEMLIRDTHPRIAALPGVGGLSTLGTGRIVIVVDPDKIFELARRAAVSGLRVASSHLTAVE